MRFHCNKFFLFIIIFISPITYANERLIFAIDLIRHGDRTPLETLPKAPHEWRLGLGELTAEGMQQEFQLGSQCRQKYVTQYHLLPPKYQPDTLYVRSTDYDRTLMSAESFLLGLYPPGTGPTLDNAQPALPYDYQPIPINTVPRKEDDLLVPDNNAEKYQQLRSQYAETRPDWQAKTNALKPKFAYWSEVTGQPITRLDDLGILADTLYIFQLKHIPLPPGLSDADIKQMMDAGTWSFIATYQTPQIGSITGHPLLMTIAKYLKKAAEHPSPLKYILFSAHDSTILSLMSAMHVPLAEEPHYASDVNFSLFEDEKGNVIVRIRYNGKPVILPTCGKADCTLAEFLNDISIS